MSASDMHDPAISRAHGIAKDIESLLPFIPPVYAYQPDFSTGLANAIYILRRLRNAMETDALPNRWKRAND